MMQRLSTVLLLVAALLMGSATTNTAQAQNGSADKPTITITEYSDYECPACAYFHPIVEKLKENFGDQINFNFKYFPLSGHQFAAIAARAVQSAKNQGKFYEMHSMLFENQKRWTSSGNPAPIFVDYAKKLDLDIQQFKSDLNAAETQKIVMEQKQEGRRDGVRATPTFIIEGEVLDPLPRYYEQFEQIVQNYLNQKTSSGE